MAGQILMVLATQSHNIRAFFKSNEEPLLRLGLGTLSCYLGLLALSKSYESKKLSDELAGQAIQFRATKEALTDEKWLQNATLLILKAAQDVSRLNDDTTSTNRSLTGNKSASELILGNGNQQLTIASLVLRQEIETAFITGERKGIQESRAREWMPELTLPRTDAVKEGRERRDALLLTSSKRQNGETSNTDTRPVESSISLNNTEKITTTNTNTALAPSGFRRSGLI
jgi:hypothetical protein